MSKSNKGRLSPVAGHKISNNQVAGGGSDGRRKSIIRDRLGQDLLFESWRVQFKSRFVELAEALETGVCEALMSHLLVMRGTFDIIRGDNVALESDRDPEFRDRVADAVRRVREEIEQIHIAANVQSTAT